MITLASKCALLDDLYELHHRVCSEHALACSKGCDACCTCNVTVTTLETYRLVRRLQETGGLDRLAGIEAAAPAGRFQPRTTVNQMADLCARDKAIPDEFIDPSAGGCPLLTDTICSFYDTRPFGCRAMVSRTRCRPETDADMPDVLFTVNNVFLQYIEAIDLPGLSGNLLDVLIYLLDDGFRRGYEQQSIGPVGALLPNRPIPALMIPPDHRQLLEPVVKQIQALIKRAYLQSGLHAT